MSMHEDLPLFRWQPPAVEVIPFPTNRRIAHIRRTADRIYFSRTTREAEAYWKRAMDGLARQMSKAGVVPDRVETELRTFHDCVQGEMVRLSRAYTSQPGGDAA